MYRKLINSMYVINILLQSLFNLATPILLMLGLSWLLVSKLSAPSWLYALLGVLGVLVGLVYMIKFIISACDSLERLEKEQQESDRKKSEKSERCD